MTVEEFLNRTPEEDGCTIVSVAEHKRMENGPAHIVLTPELDKAIQTYLEHVRPSVVRDNVKYLFLSSGGLHMSSSKFFASYLTISDFI